MRFKYYRKKNEKEKQKLSVFTVVVSLGGVVTGGAAVDGLFATVDQVGGGPGVCQPRIVAHAASQHTRSAGTL